MGTKKIEGRLLKGIFTQLCIGDTLMFINKNESYNTKIIKINCYKNFRDMLSNENIKNVVPYCATIEDGVCLYKNIYKQKIGKYKVVAIHFDTK
jgi:ASC-1-like (ASCH) protein